MAGKNYAKYANFFPSHSPRNEKYAAKRELLFRFAFKPVSEPLC